MFEFVSDYQPAGDQPQAIAKLTEGVLAGEFRVRGNRWQTTSAGDFH